MITKSTVKNILGALALAGGLLTASGAANEASAQVRDPFMKPAAKVVRTAKPSTGKTGLPGVTTPNGPLGAPPVEQRVNYYMNVIRPQCVAQGCAQMPKPTVVMTLDEMNVVGISRTPRGYAAIVELKPINLSYTIYPGEKFFDGQLVAVEDNQLIFRKVTKMSNGKLAVNEEKKVLRKMNFQEELARNSVDALPSSGVTEDEKKSQPRPVERASAAGQPPVADPNKLVFPMDELLKEKDAPKDAKETKPAAKGKGKSVARKKN